MTQQVSHMHTSPEPESESYVMTDGQSASLSWIKAPICGLRPDLYYRQTVAGFLMWGALSEERTDLSFTIAAGPRQHSHSWVRVPWDSRPYFTVSDSRLPFTLPPTTRRVTVEVFDLTSTRFLCYSVLSVATGICVSRCLANELPLLLLFRLSGISTNTSWNFLLHLSFHPAVFSTVAQEFSIRPSLHVQAYKGTILALNQPFILFVFCFNLYTRVFTKFWYTEPVFSQTSLTRYIIRAFWRLALVCSVSCSSK
jgi:hypothetical protein